MDTAREEEVLLLVEADGDVAGLIERELRACGFHVRRTDSLEGARKRIRSGPFAAVLVGTRLPDGSGYALAAAVREVDRDAPVLLLARSGDPDELLFLPGGSPSRQPVIYDDLPALRERVVRLLRHEPSPPTAGLRCGPLAFDRSLQGVHCDGAPLHVTPIEYRLLEQLAIGGGRGASTADLLRAGWGPGTRRSSNVLAVHIGNLRRKLNHAGAGARIDGVRNFGYVLRCVRSGDADSRFRPGAGR